MSNQDKDDLADVVALPVYDRVTSKFMWLKKPPTASTKPEALTYGIEVTDEDGKPMTFVAGGFRCKNTPD